MLASLHIENLAVIRSLDLEFEPDFCVLTGETGAGKSVILDSINLLLGNRFSRELIRSGETRATVSGLFCGFAEQTLAALEALGVTPDEEGGLLVAEDRHYRRSHANATQRAEHYACSSAGD